MIARSRPLPKESGAEREALGPILADASYPLPVFQLFTGLSKSAVRQARRDGLIVKKVGKREFVRGADWDAYLASKAKTVE